MKYNSIYKSLKAGIISVLGSNMINKIVALISNILVVRFVSQQEYGLLSSAFNIISLVMLFTGAGTINGVLQYGSEKREDIEKLQYFKYSFFIGTMFDILLTIIVCLYSGLNFIPLIEAKKYVFMFAPTIILHFLFEYLGAIIRSKKEAKKYAIMMNVNSLSYSILSCIGAYYYGVSGMIIGRNISYVLGIVVGIMFNYKILFLMVLKIEQKLKFLIYSLSCCVTAALNRLLYIIDITVVSYIVKDANEVAIYKVGTQIPESLEFIPYSILIAVIPYFAENKENSKWLHTWTKRLYCYSGILNLVITIVLIMGSSTIIDVFWGEQYQRSVPIFIMLSLNYFIMATFRQTGTNILSALRAVKYNVIISCISCILNIVLDIIFVYKWGIYGAAMATVVVVIFASMLSFPYIFKLIYGKGVA